MRNICNNLNLSKIELYENVRVALVILEIFLLHFFIKEMTDSYGKVLEANDNILYIWPTYIRYNIVENTVTS